MAPESEYDGVSVSIEEGPRPHVAHHQILCHTVPHWPPPNSVPQWPKEPHRGTRGEHQRLFVAPTTCEVPAATRRADVNFWVWLCCDVIFSAPTT